MTSHRFGIAVCLSLGIASTAAAQNANVYYSHVPGNASSNRRTSFVESGERTGRGATDRHEGQPSQLEIPKGSKACVSIENANPLLYDYKIESKAITIAAPEGYGDILAGLSAIIPGMVPKPAGAPPPAGSPAEATAKAEADLVKHYSNLIKFIADQGVGLDAIKQASDAGTIDFAAAEALKKAVDDSNAVAEKVYKTGDDAKNIVIQQLRLAHVAAKKAFDGLAKEFAEAKALMVPYDPQYCVDMSDKPLHIAVSASRKDSAKTPARPVGVLAEFDADPTNTKNFDVLPVGMISFGVADAKRFYLDDQSLLQEKADHGFYPAVGMLASFRLAGPVWIGAAAAKGQTGTPDTFLGLVLRSPSITQSFVLGVGAAFASVPADLQDGVVLNKPLPAGSDLTKVVKKETKVGIGIIVTISGLSFSK